MNKLVIAGSFFAGLAVGSSITAYFMRKQMDAEVESVKETWKNHYQTLDDKSGDISEKDSDVVCPDYSSEELRDARKKYSEMVDKEFYVDYSSVYPKPDVYSDTPVEINGEEETEREDDPYVIPPEELGETGYDVISLVCFEDGVITDDNYDIIDNYEECIGKNACVHFGDYEDDAVHIRNDEKQLDYEILKDERLYADAIAKEPRRINL